MFIPCVTIIIPVMTSPVRIEPSYMVPIYQEIWRARLASEGKMGVEVVPAPGAFREIDSVDSEKADLSGRFNFNPANGAPLFDKIYPGDSFEIAVEAILAEEAAKEIAQANPVLRVANADFMAIVKNEDLANSLEDLGLPTIADVAGAPISKICEIKGFTPGQASKLLAVFVQAKADDEAAKITAAALPKITEEQARKASK